MNPELYPAFYHHRYASKKRPRCRLWRRVLFLGHDWAMTRWQQRRCRMSTGLLCTLEFHCKHCGSNGWLSAAGDDGIKILLADFGLEVPEAGEKESVEGVVV